MDTQSFIAQRALIALALEAGAEDYTGLYEIIWELNNKFPSVAEAEKIRMARQAIEHCLSQGLVELYQTCWPPVEYIPAPEDAARAALALDATWRMEQGGPKAFLAYCTTQRGEQELARLHQVKGAA